MAKEDKRSPLQRVREELKRWRGQKITPETRPGPWWNHEGWEEPGVPDEMAHENPEMALLRDAIDWTGVSDDLKDKILGEHWKPFPEALTREHELNGLVETVGGWGNNEEVERLKNAMLDEAATHMYESARIKGHLGKGTVHVDVVSEADGYYRSERSLTLEGTKEDIRQRYGNWGIHYAYEMLSDWRGHIESMRDRGAAVLEAGASTREGTAKERHRWLVGGNLGAALKLAHTRNGWRAEESTGGAPTWRPIISVI